MAMVVKLYEAGNVCWVVSVKRTDVCVRLCLNTITRSSHTRSCLFWPTTVIFQGSSKYILEGRDLSLSVLFISL